jgi:two-component system, response regulator YesN
VISDLRLTGTCGKEGLEILQYIREQKLDTRVILVTGYGNFEIMNEAFKLGASFYFEKPVSREALIQALETLGFP